MLYEKGLQRNVLTYDILGTHSARKKISPVGNQKQLFTYMKNSDRVRYFKAQLAENGKVVPEIPMEIEDEDEFYF